MIHVDVAHVLVSSPHILSWSLFMSFSLVDDWSCDSFGKRVFLRATCCNRDSFSISVVMWIRGLTIRGYALLCDSLGNGWRLLNKVCMLMRGSVFTGCSYLDFSQCTHKKNERGHSFRSCSASGPVYALREVLNISNPARGGLLLYPFARAHWASRKGRKEVSWSGGVSHSCNEHGMVMEQGLGRRSELYHGGGSLCASRVHDSSWSNRIWSLCLPSWKRRCCVVKLGEETRWIFSSMCIFVMFFFFFLRSQCQGDDYFI